MAQEKQFEEKIKKFLTEQDCWFVKYFANGFTKAGIPDILCCCNGYFIAIEVKASKGKPSGLQIKNLEMIDDVNGYGILLYPKDFKLFKNFIDCLQEEDFENAEYNYQIFRRDIEKWKKKLSNC